MAKLNYMNLGCGSTFHSDWINVDLAPQSPEVIDCNLLKGIPYPDNDLDVIYHSHVLEHFSKEMGMDLVKECFRVLKPGGIIRIVVPDLENIAKEYLKHLNENIENPTERSNANYDWNVIELLDQSIRNSSGGDLTDFLSQPELVNEDYVYSRIGSIGRWLRKQYLNQTAAAKKEEGSLKDKLRGIKRRLGSIIKDNPAYQARKIGKYRMSGEVHMWMYDRYSLSRLLKEIGFVDVELKTAFESNIPDWGKYELDVKGGEVYIPTSLYMEAKKPL